MEATTKRRTHQRRVWVVLFFTICLMLVAQFRNFQTLDRAQYHYAKAVLFSMAPMLGPSDSSLDLHSVLFFNSFANPKRRAFMESWLTNMTKINKNSIYANTTVIQRIEPLAPDAKVMTHCLNATLRDKNECLMDTSIRRTYEEYFVREMEAFGWDNSTQDDRDVLVWHRDDVDMVEPAFSASMMSSLSSTRDKHIELLAKALRELPPSVQVVRLTSVSSATDEQELFTAHVHNNTDPENCESKLWTRSAGMVWRHRALQTFEKRYSQLKESQLKKGKKKGKKSNTKLHAIVTNPLASMECLLTALDMKIATLPIVWEHNLHHAIKKEDVVRPVISAGPALGMKYAPLETLRRFNQEQYSQNRSTSSSTSSLLESNRIDRVYYINLEKNVLRQQQMETYLPDEIGKNGNETTMIPYQRVVAQRGQEDFCYKKGTACIGMSGLILTLLGILNLPNTAIGNSLILEDDFRIRDPGLERLEQILHLVPPDWDLIRLDCWGMEWTGTFHSKPNEYTTQMGNLTCFDPNSFCYYCGGTYAMIFRGSRIEKLREMWSQRPFYPADCQINSWAEKYPKTFKSYCVNVGIGDYITIQAEDTDIVK